MSDYEKEDTMEAKVPEFEYAYSKGEQYADECFYGIGSTTPPKDYTAVVSGVLVLMISFCGMLTALSLMNINPFPQVSEPTEPEAGVLVSFSPSGGKLPQGLEQVDQAVQNPELQTGGEEQVDLGGMQIQIHGIPTQPTISGTDVGDDPTEQTLPPAQPNADECKLSWQQVYSKLIPSVVSVVCSDGYTTSSGTGVIMDERGYIITNAHVVEDAQAIQVLLSDDRTVSARCIGLDSVSDLAVLHIQAEGLVAAEFGDSEALQVGDSVVAIGDPLGVELRGTMTDGIISAINRDLEVNGRNMSLLQTTAALNNGNSGGPLVNCYGQVVGIVAMKIGDYASSSGVEGLGFAIPMSTVKNVVEQLAQNGYVAGRPSLGLSGEIISSFHQYYYRLPVGMMLTQVESDSDAAQKGIQEGDILLYLDGVRIKELETYQNTVNGLEVGQEVAVVIYRSGREYEVTLTVGENHK